MIAVIDGARPLTELGGFILSGWKDAGYPNALAAMATFGPDKDGYYWNLVRIQSGTEDYPVSLTRKWVCPTAEAALVRCDWANEIDGEIVLSASLADARLERRAKANRRAKSRKET